MGDFVKMVASMEWVHGELSYSTAFLLVVALLF